VEASDEPIEGRITDARNYLLLLGAIYKEKKEQGGGAVVGESE
jgi:hypothetical protein